MTPPIQSIGGGCPDCARFRDLIACKNQYIMIALESRWQLDPVDQVKPNE